MADIATLLEETIRGVRIVKEFTMEHSRSVASTGDQQASPLEPHAQGCSADVSGHEMLAGSS